MSTQGKTPTVDTVMEAWQRDAKPPTRAQIVAMKQEHAELRETAARQASLLRGCYAAEHKQKERIEELTAELGRIKALEPVAWAFKHADGSINDPSTTEHSVGMIGLYALGSKHD